MIIGDDFIDSISILESSVNCTLLVATVQEDNDNGNDYHDGYNAKDDASNFSSRESIPRIATSSGRRRIFCRGRALRSRSSRCASIQTARRGSLSRRRSRSGRRSGRGSLRGVASRR